MSDSASKLFHELTKEHPAPWKLEYHWHTDYISRVVAANGEPVLSLELYTGDGDHFYLGNSAVKALAEFVNEQHRGKGIT